MVAIFFLLLLWWGQVTQIYYGYYQLLKFTIATVVTNLVTINAFMI